MSDTEYEGKGFVADRLDQLFATVTADGRSFTLKEAAEGINAKAGEPLVSVQYLSQLRKGDRRRPSLVVLEAISSWFGVSVTYFTNENPPDHTAEELRVRKLMRDADVRTIMFRSDGISQRSLEMVKDMLTALRIAEGLPPAQAEDEPGPPGRLTRRHQDSCVQST